MRPQVEAGLWIIKREDWEVCGHFKGQVWYRMCECLIWEMPHSLSSEVVLWELFHFICVTQTWFLAQCNVWREARRFMSLPASLWCTSLLFNRVANLWLYLESLDNILVCLSLWFCSLYVGHTQNVPAEWRVLVLLSLSLLWQCGKCFCHRCGWEYYGRFWQNYPIWIKVGNVILWLATVKVHHVTEAVPAIVYFCSVRWL